MLLPLLLSFLHCVAAPIDRLHLPGPTIEDMKQEILAMRITDGPLRGFYHTSSGGVGTRFYEVLLGLDAVAEDPRFQIGDALEVYIRNVDVATGLVQDYDDDTGNARRDSDSDDSYAASLLLLAARYFRSPAGEAWWVRNHDRVETIVDKVILQNQVRQSNGGVLIRTFSTKRAILKGPECRLMDCCEVYSGLRAVLPALEKTGDPKAPIYRSVADDLAKGIATLYSDEFSAFYVMDTERDAKIPFSNQGELRSYPNLTAQVFPEAYRIPIGDPVKTAVAYAAGWSYLNAHAPGWPANIWPDGSTGGFPWTFLGYVAVKRGNPEAALRQAETYAPLWTTPPDGYFGKHIGEIGYRIRTATILGS